MVAHSREPKLYGLLLQLLAGLLRRQRTRELCRCHDANNVRTAPTRVVWHLTIREVQNVSFCGKRPLQSDHIRDAQCNEKEDIWLHSVKLTVASALITQAHELVNKISIERTFDHRFPSHPKNKLSVNLKKDGQTKVKRQIFGFIGRRGEIGNVLDAFSIFIAWN